MLPMEQRGWPLISSRTKHLVTKMIRTRVCLEKEQKDNADVRGKIIKGEVGETNQQTVRNTAAREMEGSKAADRREVSIPASAGHSDPLQDKVACFIRHNFSKRQLSLRKKVKNFPPIHCEALGKNHCPQMTAPRGSWM